MAMAMASQPASHRAMSSADRLQRRKGPSSSPHLLLLLRDVPLFHSCCFPSLDNQDLCRPAQVLVTKFELGLSFPSTNEHGSMQAGTGGKGCTGIKVGRKKKKNTQTLGCWFDLLERFHASSGLLLGSDSTKRDSVVAVEISPRLDRRAATG